MLWCALSKVPAAVSGSAVQCAAVPQKALSSLCSLGSAAATHDGTGSAHAVISSEAESSDFSRTLSLLRLARLKTSRREKAFKDCWPFWPSTYQHRHISEGLFSL